jgi:sporulation protein YlmC with PRC-barrel domain
MNESEVLRAILLASSLAAAPVHAQITSSSSPTEAAQYVQTSRIVGMKVKDSNGEAVGTIRDVVLDRETGCMAYTVISTGDSSTRLTGTTKTVAVPWKVYSASSSSEVMTLTVDRERVYAAPAFEYSRINEYSIGSYIDNIYSYYGLQSSAPATAGSNATATPTVQPSIPAQSEASVSPVATEIPSPSVTATAAASPTSTPTATETPGATATVTTSPSATVKPRPSWAAAAARRTSATPTASPKEKKTTTEPPGEGPGSPAKKILRYRPTPSPTPKKTTW